MSSAKFFNACREHDECYDTCGQSRTICDRNFHAKLKEECRRAFHTWFEKPALGSCYFAARLYYEAVVAYGSPMFKSAQSGCGK